MYRIITPLLSVTLVTCAYGMDSNTPPQIPQPSSLRALYNAVGALPVRIGRTICNVSCAVLKNVQCLGTKAANGINTQLIIPAHQHPYKAAAIAASIVALYLVATKTNYGKQLIASVTEKLGLRKKKQHGTSKIA